ncbi:MAG: DNA internalization-related competence protein ComEC/Rec2 [Actinobacteria bacterium]|nr:MAG: DNA internalization-related competence protein ComEC/Rec2 [Actinomycetota bacterium]
MRLPLITKLSISFAVGIIAGFYELDFSGYLLVVFVAAVSIILAKQKSIIFGILVFFLLGFSLAYLQIGAGEAFKQHLNKNVTVKGLVISDITNNERYRRFDLRLSNIDGKKTSQVIRVYTESPKIRTGDYIKASGSIKEPRSSSISDKPALFCQAQIKRLGTNYFFTAIGKTRVTVKKILLREKSDKRSFLFAMLTGQTNELSIETKNNLRASGLTHLLAVSGLHTGFIVLIIFLLFRIINIRVGYQLIILIFALFCYAAFTGFKPPVIRASIMASWLLAAYLLGRKRSWSAALSSAALMSLTINPAAIFSPSFQLSYAAVTSLFVFKDKLGAFIEGIGSTLKKALSISASVQILTLPLLAYHFGEVPLFSVFANVIAIPLAIVAFYSTILALIASWAGLNILLQIPAVFSAGILKIAAFFNSFPVSTVSVSPVIVLVIIILVLLFIYLANMHFQKKSKFSISFASLLIFVLAFVVVGQLWQSSESLLGAKQLSVEFLDVGQGDATLLKGPRREKILIDSGPSPYLIQNHLIKRKVKTLDMIVASHADSDHISGFAQVLANFDVKSVLDNGYPKDTELYREFMKAIKIKKIKYILARRGKVINVGRLKLSVLHPSKVYIERTTSDDNNNSIVLNVNYLKHSFLFTGDIGFEAEKNLMQSQNLRAQVLKVSHHGSALATSQSFLTTVRPNFAVISVGDGNRYGHPRPSLINRLKKARAIVYRTDISSDIKMFVDSRGLRVYE